MKTLPKSCFSCKCDASENCGADEYGDSKCKKINGIKENIEGIIIEFTKEIPSEVAVFLFVSDKDQSLQIIYVDEKDLEKQLKDEKYLSGGKWCKIKSIINEEE